MKLEEYAWISIIFITIYILHYIIDNWSKISNDLDSQFKEPDQVHAYLKVKLKETPYNSAQVSLKQII